MKILDWTNAYPIFLSAKPIPSP